MGLATELFYNSTAQHALPAYLSMLANISAAHGGAGRSTRVVCVPRFVSRGRRAMEICAGKNGVLSLALLTHYAPRIAQRCPEEL